jgi:hypothetical protein
MAFATTFSFEVQTRNPAIVVEVHEYTKDAGDATGTITKRKGRKIREILAKSDAAATAAISNKTAVALTGLAASGSDSLSGFVAIEVERI